MPEMLNPISLPIHPRPRRPGKRARWRAYVLIAVHIAFAVHIWHWLTFGRTITPVEPSEAMQTLREGLVNAGFVLFGTAIIATLVFGRWFCGWACHIIAVQDLCSYLLGKVGFKATPFRSRLLVFVPLIAALYMFVWPVVARLIEGVPMPPIFAHFTTTDFWETFPGFWFSLLTFIVCGGLIVIILGNKGFCTYGCPYGGFFGFVDRAAPLRIRVNNNCIQSGQCTENCTSNVNVAREVHEYGMVVDPGCMKCTDCVEGCPTDALFVGWGTPGAIASRRNTASDSSKQAAATNAARDSDAAPVSDFGKPLAWYEELLLGWGFVVGLYAIWGLYDTPFLLSLGIASIIAYLLLLGGQVFWRRDVWLQRVPLKVAGVRRSGTIAYAAFLVVLALFLGHSIWVQYHARTASQLLMEADRAALATPADDASIRSASSAARAHLLRVHHDGLFKSPRIEGLLANLGLYFDDLDAAERHATTALALKPDYGFARYCLAQVLGRRWDTQRDPALFDRAYDELTQALRDDPSLADARSDLIFLSQGLGRLEETEQFLIQLADERPFDPHLQIQVAELAAQAGRFDEAWARISAASLKHQRHVGLALLKSRLALSRGSALEAFTAAERAREFAPFDTRVLSLLAIAWGNLTGEDRAELQSRFSRSSPAELYARSFLTLSDGDPGESDRLYLLAAQERPDLVRPTSLAGAPR